MVDVCLILEGTYPRVTGGVSQWVQDLTSGLPELTFAVSRLGFGPQMLPVRYEPPRNVCRIDEIELDREQPAQTDAAESALPEACVYHALSTGLAGVVGARGAAARGRPFVLTEHGLYVREAMLGAKTSTRRREEREAWLELLDALAREAYDSAFAVTTVCQANARAQRALGAPKRRVRVIPNAVADAGPRHRRPGRLTAPRIGFVGRVVPIKDVATFVRACALVAAELPRATFTVVGPLDQRPGYVERCRELAAELGLGERLRLTGEGNPWPWYAAFDVVVLTSVSEAQPLVALEAMSAGTPVVATAVGGVPEIVPRALLTPPRDARAVARTVLRLCGDPELRALAVREGRERISREHTPAGLARAYRSLYTAAAR